MVYDFSPQLFFYKTYFIFFLQSVSGTIIGSYQEFSESGNGNMIEGVAPAARFLSPARAPRGLHRALFMNSVSHGKIWTNNAASL
jgi:hypothetical protein